MSTTNVNRPTTLDKFVINDSIKNIINFTMRSAKKQNRSFPHTLITSGAGTGKTTLANIIANEMGVDIRVLMGPSIKDSDDISNAFVGLKDQDILFIDEIHALKKNLQEMLYSAMEDRFIPKKVDDHTFNYKIKDVTIILTTNESSNLPGPLVDRCRLKIKLDNYSNEDISKIIKMNAKIINIGITDDAAMMLANVCRGIPRISINNLITIKDYVVDAEAKEITVDVLKSALEIMGVDEYGLTDIDRRILHTLFKAKKLSRESLASMIGYNPDILEKEYEPYLMIQGLMIRSSKGRMLSEKGWTMIADELI
jgi:Holliday junction DNA helicase RuvB